MPPAEVFWQGCRNDIASNNSQFVFKNAEHEDECKQIALKWWRESKKAGIYCQATYASHSPSIDVSGIAELVVKGVTVQSEKRLVELKMKNKVRGFDPYDSDKFVLFWTKDWLLKPSDGAAANPVPTFVPPNISLPPPVNLPTFPLPSSALADVDVSDPPKIGVKKEKNKKGADVEKQAKFDVFAAEKEKSLLNKKMKKSFNTSTPSDFSLDTGISYFEKCGAVLEAYESHYHEKYNHRPDWGKPLMESLFCQPSASRPFGTGLDIRAPNGFRFMIVWVWLDSTSASAFWNSIDKEVDPKKATSATKIRNDGLEKFKTWLKKKKLKRASIKFSFDRIFGRWFKKHVTPYLK